MPKIKKVDQFSVNGDYIQTFNSVTDAERAVGCPTPGNGTLVRAIKYQSVSKGYLWKYSDGAHEEAHEEAQVPKVESTHTSMSLSEKDLLQRHDVTYKIMTKIKTIPKGEYWEESDFLRRIGVFGKPRTKRFMESIEMRQYRGKVDNIRYVGHPESIQKLKEQGVLS